MQQKQVPVGLNLKQRACFLSRDRPAKLGTHLMLGAILGFLSFEGVERPFGAPAMLASPVHFLVGGARGDFAVVGGESRFCQPPQLARRREGTRLRLQNMTALYPAYGRLQHMQTTVKTESADTQRDRRQRQQLFSASNSRCQNFRVKTELSLMASPSSPLLARMGTDI